MGASSKIEWTDATWNPIRAWLKSSMIDVPPQRWGYHCERISPGCKNCYASTMNGRMLPSWGTGLDYTVPNREKVEIFLDEEESIRPLHWKKPRKIFPCSMTDWCADFVTDEMRDRMMAIAALCPQHTFLFLTKRAERCAEYFSDDSRVLAPLIRTYQDRDLTRSMSIAECIVYMDQTTGSPFLDWPSGDEVARLKYWPLPNVLLGFSAENQECFDTRWGHMRKLAAAGWKVWCSAEPLLGPLDLRIPLGASGPAEYPSEFEKWPSGRRDEWFKMQARATYISRADMLSWVVVGGESGHGARPMNVAWVRSIIRQCKDAGVPCFVKQLGAKPGQERDTKGDWHPWLLRDRKGGDMSEWPEDLRVREFPQ